MTTIQGRIPVLLRRLLMVAVVVGFLALAGTLTASAEPAPDPPRPPQDCRGETNPGWADLTDCASKKPQPGQPQPQQPGRSGGSSAPVPGPASRVGSSAPAAPARPAGPPRPSLSAGVRPTTAPQEWAAESGSAVEQIGDEVARRAKSRDRMVEWRKALAGPYAVTLAIGWFLLAVVMVVNIARASYGGSRAEAREVLHRVLPKFIMYGPLSVLLPGLAAYLLDLGQNLTDTALAASGNEFASLIQTLGSRFSRAPLRDGAAVVVGTATGWSALLFLIAAVLLIVTLVSWLLQDWVAPMSMYLLTLMIPIVLALATQPRQQQRLLRLLGAILGTMLTPFITRFMFWATLPLISAELSDTNTELTLSVFKVIALLAVCTSAPLVLSYVMPHLLEGAGNIQAGQGLIGGLGQAGKPLMDAGQQLSKQIRAGMQTGPGTPAAAQRASVLSKAGYGSAKAAAAGGGKTAAAGAAGGGAAAALGPLAAVAAAGVAVGQAVVGSARSAAAQSLAASGGGHASDPTTEFPIPQPSSDTETNEAAAAKTDPAQASTTPTPTADNERRAIVSRALFKSLPPPSKPPTPKSPTPTPKPPTPVSKPALPVPKPALPAPRLELLPPSKPRLALPPGPSATNTTRPPTPPSKRDT